MKARNTFNLLAKAMIVERPRRLHIQRVPTRSPLKLDPTPQFDGLGNDNLQTQDFGPVMPMDKEQPKSYTRKRVEDAANRTVETYMRRIGKFFIGVFGLLLIGNWTTQKQQDSVKQFVDDLVKDRPLLKAPKEKYLWKSLEEVAKKKADDEVLRNLSKAIASSYEEKAEMQKKHQEELANFEARINVLEVDLAICKTVSKTANSLPKPQVTKPKTKEEGRSK